MLVLKFWLRHTFSQLLILRFSLFKEDSYINLFNFKIHSNLKDSFFKSESYSSISKYINEKLVKHIFAPSRIAELALKNSKQRLI